MSTQVYVSIHVESFSETYTEEYPSSEGSFYWALLKYDKAGLYFRHPDMAKYHTYNELGEEYRELLELIQVASMHGQERAELKPKPEKKKKEPRRYF